MYTGSDIGLVYSVVVHRNELRKKGLKCGYTDSDINLVYIAVGYASDDIALAYTAVGYACPISLLAYQPLGKYPLRKIYEIDVYMIRFII